MTYGLALWAVQPVQFKVVSHTAVLFQQGRHWPSLVFAVIVFLGIIALAGWAARWDTGVKSVPHRDPWVAWGWLLWPLLISAPLACYTFVDEVPPFALSLLMILAAGWAAFRTAVHLGPDRLSSTSYLWDRLSSLSFDRLESRSHKLESRSHKLESRSHKLESRSHKPESRSHNLSHRWAHRAAVGSVVLLIALLTLIHTRLQVNFFEHFMLGHADFGHFTEELKNALAGRGLRSDSFANVRLGWHFVPLLYVLVPGYALWPSPVYLMVCSALFVHIVALPAYYLARRFSGSAAIGWMWAVAWLLLPSQSRLVYSNTYGFQWIYIAMPMLAVMMTLGLTGRWRTCLVMVALVLLCKETAAAATFGWGVYVTFFTPRRKTGVIIAVGSVLYFILCTKVLIPLFSEAGRYERLDLFGELGSTVPGILSAAFSRPDVFLARLLRRQAFYFLLVLLVPMALLPLRGWRMTIAALPTLVWVLLLQNEEWLSIKFWHQCTVLPFLFFAGIASMQPRRTRRAAGCSVRSLWRTPGDQRPPRGVDATPPREPSGTGNVAQASSCGSGWLARLSGRKTLSASALNRGMAVAVLVCAAMGHYFYGFSPISKSYQPYLAAAFLHEPDPRLETVRRIRAEILTDRTILATERLAAHFTEYTRLYTGRRMQEADFVLIDRSDTWDTSGLPQKVSQFIDDPHYRLYGEFGSIVVFEHHPGEGGQ